MFRSDIPFSFPSCITLTQRMMVQRLRGLSQRMNFKKIRLVSFLLEVTNVLAKKKVSKLEHWNASTSRLPAWGSDSTGKCDSGLD